MSRERFHSIPLRTSAHTRTTEKQPTQQQSYVSRAAMPVMPDEDAIYQSRPNPTSSRRYQGREEVLEQGNKRLVIRHMRKPTPPPLLPEPTPRRRVHWLVPVGVTLLVVLVAYVLWNAGAQALQAHNLDSTYGYPRTYQINAVVGHHDSSAHPSHFQFENLYGHVFILEIPGGDVTHARLYNGPVLYGQGADQVPVTGRFVDSQQSGKPDLLLQIGTQVLLYRNDGTQFVAPS